MNKPIVKDVLFLGQKSEPATKTDMQVAIDLQDTLKANRVGRNGQHEYWNMDKCMMSAWEVVKEIKHKG